mmetsp:Transcript_58343/g.170591  ORF Transcript_58343/g.170591 Transcript_58343/m.170591 type:complete len:210 (-) Transcript_58343:439-1068(-)
MTLRRERTWWAEPMTCTLRFEALNSILTPFSSDFHLRMPSASVIWSSCMPMSFSSLSRNSSRVPSNSRSTVTVRSCSGLVVRGRKLVLLSPLPFLVRTLTCPGVLLASAVAVTVEGVLLHDRGARSPFQVGSVQSVSALPASRLMHPIFSHSVPSNSSLPQMRSILFTSPSAYSKRTTPTGLKGRCSGFFKGAGDTLSHRGMRMAKRPK